MKAIIWSAMTVIFVTQYRAQNNLPDPSINGHNYKTAIGVRGGETSGLTIKRLNSGGTGFEAILGVWNQGLSATLLLEKQAEAFDVDGLNWYYGIGGHVSMSSNSRFFKYGRRYQRYADGRYGIGVDGILGLEYKIDGAPIAISFDVKPYLEVISGGYFWSSLDPGLGIKVTF